MSAPATEKKPTRVPRKLLEPLGRWLRTVNRSAVVERTVGLVLALVSRVAKFAATVVPLVRKQTRSHLDYLRRQEAWLFIPLVGLWTVVFKTVAVPVAALSSHLVLTPLGIHRVLMANPILDLADYLTLKLYEMPSMGLGWSGLSIVCQLVLVGVVLPVIATLSAQLLCLDLLAGAIPKVRWRVGLSLVFTGFVYVLAYGELALLITGAAVAIPLTATFLHWKARGTVRRAVWITSMVHVFANALVVLCRGFFGGM